MPLSLKIFFFFFSFQGIFNVSLSDVPVLGWNSTGFKFDTIFESTLSVIETKNVLETKTLKLGPQILIGHFNLTTEEEPKDTYLNTAEWGKGVAFVNGHNLGRYWSLMGPQMTLYVPRTYLKKGKNKLALVELEYVPENRKINFQTFPVLDYLSEHEKNLVFDE